MFAILHKVEQDTRFYMIVDHNENLWQHEFKPHGITTGCATLKIALDTIADLALLDNQTKFTVEIMCTK